MVDPQTPPKRRITSKTPSPAPPQHGPESPQPSPSIFRGALQQLELDGMMSPIGHARDCPSPEVVASSQEPPAEVASLTKRQQAASGTIFDEGGFPTCNALGSAGHPLPPDMSPLGPRTQRRKADALDARAAGANAFVHSAERTPSEARKRISAKMTPPTGEKQLVGQSAPKGKGTAAPATAGAGGDEPLICPALCGPTKGKRPLYELCAKGERSGKRIHIMTLGVNSHPAAGSIAESVRRHVEETKCTKREAVACRDKLLKE